MNREQYLNRKQYVEQARNSFGISAENNKNSHQKNRSGYYETDGEDVEAIPRSFFKIRLLLAVLLFLGFFFIQQTEWSYKNIDASSIQKRIETSINLPESFPSLSDVVSILE